MLDKASLPANNETMRLQFYDPILFHRVLQFEWAILIICAVGEGVAFRFAPPDPTAPNLGVSLIILAIFSLVSGFAPVREPYWDRFCYLLLQLELVTGATAAGLARFIFPLFLIIVAKACLLLDKRGIYAFQIITCLAQLGYSIYKISLKNPELFTHITSPTSLLLVLGQSVVYCYVSLALVVLVAMLTQSLVAEQKARLTTEKLANEVQALATELERTRIAREIHDSLGHTLTSLNIQLEIARKFQDREPERCTEALDISKGLASQSLTDVRMAINSIRNDSDFDFENAVTSLVCDLRQMQSSMTVNLEMNQVTELPPSVGFQLFRIVQECLTNALKHANASEVTVVVEKGATGLALNVKDNGKGLDNPQASSGFGIKGMQERVEGMNGTVTISAEQDKGTNIEVRIPLKVG